MPIPPGGANPPAVGSGGGRSCKTGRAADSSMMAEWQNVVSYMIPIDKTRATHASCVVRTLYPARVRRRTLCVVERCAVECVPSTVGLVAGSNAISAAMWSSLVVGLSAETAPNTRLR